MAKAGGKGNSRQDLGELSFWYIEYREGRQANRQVSRGQAENEMERQSTPKETLSLFNSP